MTLDPTLHQPPFEIRPSAIQGRGAFATRGIREGEPIVEYTGARIGQEEADARYDDDAQERPHTFLFTVDDEIVIDGADGGNEARFINHSCEPNCIAYVEDGKVFIYALTDIPAGTELTYDYLLEREGRFRPSWRERYACRCGAASCRGIMLKNAPRRRPRARPKKRAATKKRAAKT